MDSFVAIDFETADEKRDSACAVALVRVDGERISRKEHRLIRPPRCRFRFSHIHGISWTDVCAEPEFREVWLDLEPILEGTRMLVAHNAGFDRSVLLCCARAAGLNPPRLPFHCTVKLAREAWHIHPTTLPAVCSYLGLELKHHDALSDAEACARIMIAARKTLCDQGKSRR